MQKPMPVPRSIICVDLDGTLSQTDTLLEAILMLAKQSPLSLLLLPFWLIKGKAHFKAEIARRVNFDAGALLYRASLLDWLKLEHERGSQLVLATGATERIARVVASHLGIFDEIIASDDRINLTGSAKAQALNERFGSFTYIGNDTVDLPVWREAQAAMLAVDDPREEKRLAAQIGFSEVFRTDEARASSLRVWMRALRLHQWAKNVLMFVPLVLAHQALDPDKIGALLIGFLAFSLCASSVYLLNDLLDLGVDRLHPRKRTRPFASGNLPLAHGVAVFPLLLAISFALAWYAGGAFALALGVYYVTTLAYSFALKRFALIDVFALASLYTLRIIAGAVVAQVVLSPWLLGFSIFLFLSLGVVKRVAELGVAQARRVTILHGRGYGTDDLAILQMLGVAAGYASVVVLSLYISAPEAHLLYPRAELLWLMAPLMLYWVSHMWLVTHRGEMHDDPIVFAIKDRSSQVIALLVGIVINLAAI
jgi:4-hydroxybenzoate polyprenyltransferase